MAEHSPFHILAVQKMVGVMMYEFYGCERCKWETMKPRGTLVETELEHALEGCNGSLRDITLSIWEAAGG